MAQGRPKSSTRTRSKAQPSSRLRRFRDWLQGRNAAERRWHQRLKRYVIVGLPGAFLFSMLLLTVAYAFIDIPKPTDISIARSTIVQDRNGKLIARLHGEADRVDIPFEQMPQHLRQAVVAAEDRTFYTHGGVSIPSIVRAAFANVTGLGVRQGGSTITQQFVKNAYVGSERTLWRKLKEAIVSMKVERQLSKDEILEDYLNTIYLGRGAYGVEAAAQTYFRKHAQSLALHESALFAALIRAPETYDPVRNPEIAKSRRDGVLRTMASLGAITEAQASEAIAQPVKVRQRSVVSTAPSTIGAHFVEDVRRILVRDYGADRVYRGGLVVKTTLDLRLQRFAEDAVATVLDRKDDPEAALVAIDNATGGVLAMVGGRTFEANEFNLASQGRRQAGSAFKPFVLAAALDQEYSIKSRFDAPAKIKLETGFQPWEVHNYDDKDYGEIDALTATEFSVNTFYAQLILKVGPNTAAEMAALAGITSKLQAVPSLTLGTSEVTPMELTGAYATFASGGKHAQPHLIRVIQDANGDVLFESEIKPHQVVAAKVADTVAYALTQVVEKGTGRRADLGSRPVGGKTGTTEDHVDAWFQGFTRQISTGVWMGFPDGKRKMTNVRGIAVSGGSFPAQIWRAFMEDAIAELELPIEGFGKPSFDGEILNATPTPSPTPSTTLVPSLPPSTSPTPTPKQTKTPGPDPTGSPSPSPAATSSGGGG
ncbi:MAG: transglycosylase domain-containing protein [Actinomycetota bacterium]